MNSNEFMERVEYLLSDIPQEEKADAVAYYRDYLEEAGENAKKAMEDFGSPERIASIIRLELAGNLKEGGEFTERGYEDERFREPNYQVANRLDLPEGREGGEEEKRENAWQQASYNGEKAKQPVRTSRPLKIILWIVLIFVSAPIWLGAGGLLTGILAGGFALLLGIIVFLGVMTVALLLAGAGLCVVGILAMVRWFASGLLLFGAGVVVIGLGVLSLLLSILFYGKLIPWMVRSIVNGIGGLIYGRSKRK